MKLKPYYGYICWYPKYHVCLREYDDIFEVWAENEEKAKALLKNHYGIGVHCMAVNVKYRPIYHLWCKLTNRVPKQSKCNHI